MKLRSTSVAIALAVWTVLAVSESAWAQGRKTPREEKNLAGTLINQDYFTATLYPDVEHLLGLVEANHWGDRVFRNFRGQDVAWAQTDCEYVLQRFPNHPGALHMMAEIGEMTNRPGLAMPYFEVALREYPQYAYTHAQYGRFLVEQGAVSAGILELKEALRLDPSFVMAKVWLDDAERLAEVALPAVPRTRPGP